MVKQEFTERYSNKDYKVTLESKHPTTKFWPEYLSEDPTRLVVFERSKNAQLVVYSANYLDKVNKKKLDPKWPIDINWQSYGWTNAPTSNPTGVMERRLAWGYKHEPIKSAAPEKKNSSDTYEKFHITMNALPGRKAWIEISEDDGHPKVFAQVGETTARLWKVYVHTTESITMIPKVNYVELYGTCIKTGNDAYEKCIP